VHMMASDVGDACGRRRQRGSVMRMEPGGSPDGAQRSRRSGMRRWLQALTSLAIAWALLVGVLPQFADLDQVWRAVRSMTLWGVVALLVISAWSIITYGFVMMAALPGLRLWHAFLTGQIGTAVTNTVPAGSLVGIGVTYAVLSSFGHRVGSIALASVLTGWWNTLVRCALPAGALLPLALSGGEVNTGLLIAALIGLILAAGTMLVLVWVTRSERFARASGRVAGRFVSALRRPFHKPPVDGWEESFAKFQRMSAGLLKGRWHWLTLATVVSHVSLFWVLLGCLRFIGIGPDVIPWPEALEAFAVVRLATVLPLTPGGLGMVEVGTTAALMFVAGEDSGLGSEVVAAVLLFRALTYLLQVILGVLSYVVWRREMRRCRCQTADPVA
jgi:uncharacterized protein (TIRG00374 family)